MKPYYQDEAVTIYHGDCREILPDLPKVDLVLTDPPYGIDGSSGTVNVNRAKSNYSAHFTDNRQFIETVAVPVIASLTESIGCVVLTPGLKHCCRYPQPDSVGVFYHPAALGMQTFGRADASLVFYYGKNRRPNMGVVCSYQVTEHSTVKGHPCPKPDKVWATLLSNISLPGDLVLDPFLGSGTTAVAAKKLNRKCIGIEIEERYCEIAAKRCSQAVMELGI